MKSSRTKLNALIDDLIDNRLVAKPGDDGATTTHDYLNRLSTIMDELIDLSHEPDWKGRHGINHAVRSYQTHENGRFDFPIALLSDDATPEQETRAIEDAVSNVGQAADVLKRIGESQRYRRRVKETIKS